MVALLGDFLHALQCIHPYLWLSNSPSAQH